MNQANKYEGIRGWGRRMGSALYYIEVQVQLAQDTHAPANAIYREGGGYGEPNTGKWVTVDQVKNSDVLEFFRVHYPEFHAAHIEGKVVL